METIDANNGGSVLGGVGTVVVALLWSRMFPSLRRVDDLAKAGLPG